MPRHHSRCPSGPGHSASELKEWAVSIPYIHTALYDFAKYCYVCLGRILCPKTIFKGITCAIRKVGREEGCEPPLRLVVKVGVRSNQEGPRWPTLSGWYVGDPGAQPLRLRSPPPRSGLDPDSLPWATVHKEARIVSHSKSRHLHFSVMLSRGGGGTWEMGGGVCQVEEAPREAVPSAFSGESSFSVGGFHLSRGNANSQVPSTLARPGGSGLSGDPFQNVGGQGRCRAAWFLARWPADHILRLYARP